jgi:hypothetical protein
MRSREGGGRERRVRAMEGGSYPSWRLIAGTAGVIIILSMVI